MIEKVEKETSPKVTIPYNTSLKKSEKLRAAATGHSVREGCTFGKKVAILDERVENWKNRCAKSDGVLSRVDGRLSDYCNKTKGPFWKLSDYCSKTKATGAVLIKTCSKTIGKNMKLSDVLYGLPSGVRRRE